MKDSEPTPMGKPCLRSFTGRAEEYLIENPVNALAMAFCAGLLINLLPVRSLAKPVAALSVKLIPSALLGLGLLTAFDLCCPKSRPGTGGESSDR